MSVVHRTRGVVVDSSRSPHAQIRPVPIEAVTLEDAFWAPRMRVNRDSTLPSQLKLLWETGRIDNLRRAAGKIDGPFQGRYFNDSDVYKWLEAASWSLATFHDPQLEQTMDEVIAEVEEAQRPDGYLNSYFARDLENDRWTNFDLHEMYCAGHLFQAAVAHSRMTGSRRLLTIARRFADHIDATFGPEELGKRTGTDGHPEVEMGLVELARETGEPRYLKLAQFLVDARGHGFLGDAYDRFGRKYHQDHQPFRELDEIVGHAVRAVYLNAGAADIYAETGEAALGQASHRLWDNMTSKKMYISGGLGSRYEGESFGENYELPNRLAYTETCAAIGSVMWNWRMLLAESDGRYADLIERQLYNAVLPGISLDGEAYFYQNPLADEGFHVRSRWFRTACCPPNIARLLASLPGYFYGTADRDIWVHFYAEGTAQIALADGTAISLAQRTRYPWDGDIEIEVDGEGTFGLRLRIPAWCETEATLSVNGEAGTASPENGYAMLRRHWRRGDMVHLTLPMPVRRVESHPHVSENAGRVALMRGPLLYCVEQADNAALDLADIELPDASPIEAVFNPELLNGVVTLGAEASVAVPDDRWSGKLYRTASEPGKRRRPARITAIPYYAWSNRDPGPMRVWIHRS
ncbi:MAG: glycoside hydrolase family 127 protein [Thermomicrobiales bacterium]